MKLFTIPNLLFVFFLIASGAVQANDLKNHASPYLALHGNDPVNWMEWGEPAIAKAKKENKLLFVSIGYFACHWCHVMQRESYSNKGIAKQLNDNYVSIKIDRELNPVLDKRLIEFVQVTTGSAGWPLNVFLTPEGFPLVGATYMPRKHFSGVLNQLNSKWKTEQTSLTAQAKDMARTLNAMLQKQERPIKGKTTQQLASGFVAQAMQYADTMQGGFGQQRKFPQIPQLWALLKLNDKKKNKEADEFLQFTLDQMATNGLHDELAGGFYRYTTDPGWEIPHFEKMIYTNAMAPLLYFDAADKYQNTQYRTVALETLQFLKNEMRGQSNAYIASLSAVDDKGEEGGFYLWHQTELKKVLNQQELKMANLLWALDRSDELPAGNLPRQQIGLLVLADKLGQTPQEAGKALKALKQKLRLHRDKTRKLPRDTKLLAGMNGLVLAAFSRGLPYDPSLKESGEKLAMFLTSLWDGKKLRRSAANPKVGTLYDYSAVAWGLIKWGIANNNANAKQTGVAIANAAWHRFYKEKAWIENPDSLLPKGVKQAHIPDSSLISAEALLLEASFLSKEKALENKATGVLGIVTRNLEADLYSFASILVQTIKWQHWIY